MKRFINIVLGLLLMLPIAAQEEDVPVSAGTDFYFTVFEHSPEQQQIIFLQVIAISPTTMEIWVDNKLVSSQLDPFGICLGQVIQAKPLQSIHVRTSQACFLSAMVTGSTCGAETAILPMHLLGCSYMLQGAAGSLIELEGVLTPTYSQFSVVGTTNHTTVTIKPPVDLTCVTTNQTIPAGSTARFSLSEGQVLLFQPTDYTKEITGVLVNSNQPVAVFQGNNLTRIYPGENWADYIWEQARPVSNWGTDFIIPKTALLRFNIAKVTALYDNTDVYCWVNGTKMLMTTLNAGESYGRVFDTGTASVLDALHIQTTTPACCYLYFTGSTRNNGVGDPAMVEITPMDRPSTDTRWVMTQPASNAPYQIRLLVTMRTDNQNNVLINNYPPSTYNLPSVTTNEYISYEMAYSAVQSMHIQALEGGFSAYTLHIGQTSEASAMSISLPETLSPPELCLDGQLIYHQESIGSYSVYNKPLSGFCPGSQLSFSTLVSFIPYETVRLALIDPTSDTELTHYEWHFSEDESETISYNGKKWYKVGLNYTVPEEQSDVTFRIENGYNAFIDSLEVRLCTPPLTIIAPDTVCVDTKNTFIADFENDGSLSEPLQYQWYFSADSITWTPINDGNKRELKLKAKPKHTGWYKVAVAGSGNITNEMCRSVSEPHKFFVIEDCPPILCPDGILLFREDFGGNDPNEPRVSQTPVAGMTYNQLLDDYFGIMRGGSYLVTKMGYCNGDTSVTNPYRGSQWHLQDDHTYPGDYTRGYFMEVDGKGDNAAFYSTTINGLCAGSDLSFVAYVANVVRWNEYTGRPDYFAYPRLLFRLTDPTTNAELGVYDTGEIPFDSTFMNDYSCWQYSSKWHQVGMNFTVPEGLSSVQLTIYNNSQGTTGNDFAIDDIEVRLCMEPISISSVNPACRKKSHTFYGAYENWGTLESPEYMWTYSADSLTWTELQRGANKNYTIPVVHRSHEGWYRVTVADAGNMDMPNCRETSDPFKLATQYCNTAVDQYMDTTACDTLLYYDLTWRGHVWPDAGTVVDTLRDIDIDDSVYVYKTLQTTICCPEIRTSRVDSAVCDTLLPFLWFYQDTMLLFSDIGEQEIEYPHWRWENCIGEVHTLALDTFHCERLYPIIVNKYNWQLVCNNMELARIFPDMHPLEFQWFKDSVAIEGANADDYSEENELHGVFQLRIKLDRTVDNHDEYIWSNILDIHDTPAPAPIIKRVYNSQGIPVSEEQTGSGVYLIHYQQGDRVWTEKKVVL